MAYQKQLDTRLAQFMPGGAVVVELGCGSGYALDELCRLYDKAIGMDISTDRFARRETPPESWGFVQADLNERFPIDGDSVDTVLANQVIEHIQKPIFFATEVYRILRPGGVAVVATPNVRYLRHLWRLAVLGAGPKTANQEHSDGWDDGHINYFTHKDLRFIFGQAGFFEISARALIDTMGGARRLRSILDRFAGVYPVREFLSGNALLVATKASDSLAAKAINTGR